MKSTISLFLFLSIVSSGSVAQKKNSKTTQVSYSLSYNPNAENLSSRIALAPADEPGERIIITGTVYEKDSITPVKDAVLYFHQTDLRGIYSDEKCGAGCPKLEGYLKTDANGGYEISTIKPGHYPNFNSAAHIHVAVMAPNEPEYTEAFFFDGDSLLSEFHARYNGANDFGIIKLVPDAKGILRGLHHITPPQKDKQNIYTASPQTEQELRKIIDSMHVGFRKGNMQVFNKYSSDNFIFTDESSTVRDKKWVSQYGMRGFYNTDEIADVRVQEYSASAVLNFLEIDRKKTNNEVFIKKVRSTVVFIKVDTSWQMNYYHSSPVAFEHVVATVDTKILDDYTGQYQIPLYNNWTVIIKRESNTIVITDQLGVRSVCQPLSETEFFTNTEGPWGKSLQAISFVRNMENKVTHFVDRDNDGQVYVFKKTN